MKALQLSRVKFVELEKIASIRVHHDSCRLSIMDLFADLEVGEYWIGNVCADGLEDNDFGLSGLHCLGNPRDPSFGKTQEGILVNAITGRAPYTVDGFLPDIISDLCKSEKYGQLYFTFTVKRYHDYEMSYLDGRTVSNV